MGKHSAPCSYTVLRKDIFKDIFSFLAIEELKKECSSASLRWLVVELVQQLECVCVDQSYQMSALCVWCSLGNGALISPARRDGEETCQPHISIILR